MPANKVTVTHEWTLIKTTTKDTLITNGNAPFRMCVGSTTGVTHDIATPVDPYEKIIIPSGVSVYGITGADGTKANVYWTDFAV